MRSYAGYGMNADIADAVNLAWLLGAVFDGWGAPAILDAYAAERLPITEQVSQLAMEMALKILGQRRAILPQIEAPGAEGDSVRARVGREAYDLNVQQYCCGGLNFGYLYDRSPIIVYDHARQPGYNMAEFTQSTVPGCRAPHLWLADGRSLWDALGPGYTLLRRDRSTSAEVLQARSRVSGVPLTLVDLQCAADATKLYDRRLVLVRTDQHVAWRGDALPDDVAGLVDTLRGAAA
jgi:hypothetical protein